MNIYILRYTNRITSHHIMGIPYYFKKVLDNCPEALESRYSTCDRLFLDMNSAIHNAKNGITVTTANSDDFEVVVFEEICKYVDRIVEECTPSKLLYIAVDGPPPLAKMIQQRKRRYMSGYISATRWDSNAITPGTVFMEKLMRILSDHLDTISARLKIETFLSTCNERGEGEHKIFYYIRNVNLSSNGEMNNVIYGLDADLIMLSMINMRSEKIRLLRESSVFNDNDKSKEYNFIFMDIGIFRDNLIHSHLKEYEFQGTDDQIIADYICLCFLLGNDFIPNLSFIKIRYNGLENILQSYNRCKGNLLRQDKDGSWKLCYEVLIDIFDNLREAEVQKLSTIDKRYQNDILKDRTKCKTSRNDPRIPSNKEGTNILPGKSGWQLRYYNTLFGSTDMKYIDRICDNYVRGIEWCTNYYFNQRYDSNYKYESGFSPLIEDLAKRMVFLDASNQEIIPNRAIPICIHDTDTCEQDELLEQLMMVLPPSSHDKLLPNGWSNLIQDNRGGISYSYPKRFKLRSYLKNYDWECIPDLPPISLYAVKKFIQSNTTILES